MRRLILAGGGHAHLSVLHALAKRRHAGLEVVLITPDRHTIYSGMVPGWMAGHYPLSSCSIDLLALADAARVRLLEQCVVGIDAGQRFVELADGSRCEYDVLSIDVGSETRIAGLEPLGPRLQPVRPMGGFMQRWTKLVEEAVSTPGYRLVVVGGGAAGIELAFAARQAFTRLQLTATVTLVCSERGLLPRHSVRAQMLVSRWLARHGIPVHRARAAGVESGVRLATGQLLPANCVLAASGAAAPQWLRTSGLALTDEGYIQVDPAHRSVSHPTVYAAGDVCARPGSALGRSGVYAVRAGPILAKNLLAAIDGSPGLEYHPRRNSLYLLSAGSRHAIASWGWLSVSGRSVWWLKDWIDRRFVRVNSVARRPGLNDGGTAGPRTA